MKIKSLFLLAALAVFAAFKPAVQTETFTIDTQRSSIEWVGSKVTGKHNGTVKLSSGSLAFSGQKLQGGSFTTDMTTLKVLDLQGEYAQKLEGHLKNDDFFGVEKFPTSAFNITRVKMKGKDQATITGNLTIKGITHPVTFPAVVKRQGNAVVAVAKGVKIDRTKYDVKYGSNSIFGGLGDKAIDDEFILDINLAGKKS